MTTNIPRNEMEIENFVIQRANLWWPFRSAGWLWWKYVLFFV